MNAAEIAREMTPDDNATGNCLLVVDIEKLRCVCRAVLDAEEYKNRVEKVIRDMRRQAPHVKLVRHVADNWGALTGGEHE
ncbi:MAG: hypothetical protein ACYDBH_01405 [Acidobacteriaceae bacterium]